LWKSYQQFNSMVSQFAQNRPSMRYVDVGTALMGADGQPDASLFTEDKLHLNASGYAKWTAALKPVLTEVFNSKAHG
jgi:lysophospholipase L1-like esterase